jgi:hypothetical protein
MKKFADKKVRGQGGAEFDVEAEELQGPNGEPVVAARLTVNGRTYEHRVTFGPAEGPGVATTAQQVQKHLDDARQMVADTAEFREQIKAHIAAAN